MSCRSSAEVAAKVLDDATSGPSSHFLEKSVASLHRVVAGSETDQARHADVVGIVILDNSLPRKA